MFPPGFPAQFAKDAFIVGPEAAWPIDSVAEVIRWFARNHVAVLGTELWIVRDGWICPGVLEEGVRNVYGNDARRKPGESWEIYVARSAEETLLYLSTLRLPAEAKEQGNVLLNLVWANESDFLRLLAP